MNRVLSGRSLPLFLFSACTLAVGCARGTATQSVEEEEAVKEPVVVRFAAFNTSMSALGTADRPAYLGDSKPGSALAGKAEAVAAVLRAVRPDVVLLSEFDDAGDGLSILTFREMLGSEEGAAAAGGAPLAYGYAYAPEVQTGVPSGLDLDADGEVGGPGDAWGWGEYPGQFGMLLLSRFPIDRGAAVSLREGLWAELPGQAMPEDFYPPEVAGQVRLSSKTHVSVPIRVPVAGEDERPVKVLLSHPTPPVFDGAEDRNGRRNRDEIRVWTLALEDAAAQPGGAAPSVILGDLNADPLDGEADRDAINDLLSAPGVRAEIVPTSEGGPAAALRDGGLNATQAGPAANDTADFGDEAGRGPGNLRVDYALPVNLEPIDAGVFWPAGGPMAEVAGSASDHRLVWVDVAVD